VPFTPNKAELVAKADAKKNFILSVRKRDMTDWVVKELQQELRMAGHDNTSLLVTTKCTEQHNWYLAKNSTYFAARIGVRVLFRDSEKTDPARTNIKNKSLTIQNGQLAECHKGDSHKNYNTPKILEAEIKVRLDTQPNHENTGYVTKPVVEQFDVHCYADNIYMKSYQKSPTPAVSSNTTTLTP